ncbi:MAG: hypothetical protein CGU28_16470 [Candidatus Dactylopiibacterium carminicum]|uniref:diguanylate cyclase n=1 Tax=Candidatus Dactylopiibacterium carminicum TaxID=857335 RepID=A0A272EMU1_9RHOO|nr:sensor domain-containing diguanylate cyclase [Candidatus Dactylopiibacterium carminicum]PAS91423.1 MAG: hypothetical protein CGU29_16515 [Candidatus Dactylopiibacterium carminicum]PAS92538.1 MAG: hypothetical protein CGU28_16470 [Candidatus Dactylopiibacterium carminicum]
MPSGNVCAPQDGYSIPVEVSIGSELAAGGRLFVGVVRDISEQKRTEAELRLPLTGLLNRRAFNDEASRLTGLTLRHQRSLGVLVLDVDHFKRVNDTHGHAVGDEVLRQLARTVSGELRDTDLLARLGGEEFCVLMPETGSDGLKRLANRLLEAVRAMVVRLPDVSLQITVSIGGANLRDPPDTFKQALLRADEALYTAKGEGRNRVLIHGEA